MLYEVITLKILDTMPPEVMDVMNMHAFNLTTIAGFYGIMFLRITSYNVCYTKLLRN